MNEFTVSMPFAGAVIVTVEAENEEQAKEAFYKKVEEVTLWDNKALMQIGAEIEWDFYPKMGSGNMRYYQFDEIEIQDNGSIE